MRTIRDYCLEPIHGAIGFQVPKGATFLHAGNEGSSTRVWLLVDADNEEDMSVFFVALRDQPVPAWCTRETYRASVLMKRGGELEMAHVFECP